VPDLYEGDQLVVLGRYHGDAPLEFTLRGDYHGAHRAFEFTFPVEQATTRNAFVPRLWASRRIGWLVDEIRQLGADSGAAAADDPRVAELVDEIVNLSTEYGILTEYTAFLALEGTDLSDDKAVTSNTTHNLARQAMAMRSGLGAVSAGMNNATQQQQVALNPGNSFYDAAMNRVEITNVQQINDRAYFQRGARWIDSRVAQRGSSPDPDREVVLGSDEFNELARRLATQNRAGTLALRGEMLLLVDGEVILVRPPSGK
jgi:Ca-activated chloride channel family protein